METRAIPGYAFGDVGPSPVSLAELEDLKGALGFTDSDHDALRRLWEVIGSDVEALFEAWVARIGHFFAPTFAGPEGEIDERYMTATHPRFLKWVEDTCLRAYDQEWLDYQHEIALRHHRTKKNETDGAAAAVEVVPYRYLPATVAPMTLGLREFLQARGVASADASPLIDAWLKALLLHVALWSRPYVHEQDW